MEMRDGGTEEHRFVIGMSDQKKNATWYSGIGGRSVESQEEKTGTDEY